jgi:hypothetical protein
VVIFGWELGFFAAEVVVLEDSNGGGAGGFTPGVEVFGVVEALVGVKGLGWVGDLAQGAGSHGGVGAAGREDFGVVVAVEVRFVGVVGEDAGFELGFDPRFAGSRGSKFCFEAFFLVIGKPGALAAREGGRREGAVGGARGHVGLLLERVEMSVGSLTGGMRLVTVQIPNYSRKRKIPSRKVLCETFYKA